MPTVPLRRKLLNELDDIDRSFKRARLEKYLEDIRGELCFLNLPYDNLSSSSSCSSISSLSTVSDDSSLSSEENSNEDNLSSHSLSPSELEDLVFSSLQAELKALRKDIESTRILQPRPSIHKTVKEKAQISFLDIWRKENIPQFRRKVRVDPDIFDKLVAKIEDDPIFHNNSYVSQTPVKIQLAIFLYRAGHYGNAASPEAIGHWAGVSPGTVVNSSNRVMIALLGLHDEVIHLPTTEEKETAKQWVENQVCTEWRNGSMMVDGTKFSLFQRPGLHGDTWFDKNRDYSLDCQLVTLPDSLLVVDYSIGHTGSVHDSWAFQSTRVFKEHNRIFASREWLWADSAYPTETWCVSPFKKPLRRELTRDKKTYNYHVSRVRIRSEHAIGLLKGRFQALRELRIQISTSKHHKWSIMFIRCCIILHNLIIRLEGGDYDPEFREELYECGRQGWTPPSDDEDDPDSCSDEELRAARRRTETPGQRFRKEIMSRLFRSTTSGAVRR